jgi:hypothetical protein
MIKKKAQEVIFTKWLEMWELEKESRNNLSKKEKNKKRQVEQLVYNDARVEKIKQKYNQK